LAAPLANSIACARALAGGVLVRGGAALERLASVRVLAFDKTGTLTEGNLSLRGCEPLGGASADVALTIAAALEQRAEHPVARALQAYVRELRARLPAVDDLHTTPGAGISGQLGGMPVACGTAAHLRAGGFSVPSIGVQLASALAAEGATVSFVGWKGRARGLLVFTDVLRAEAAPTIARLRSDRLHPVVVSGDMLAAVQTFAGALGIDEAHAECTPEGKLALIRLLRMRHGAVAAVGDRLNDAPALAAADVGIATGATDLACEAADVVLSRDGLARLPDLFALARASRRVVIGNLAWAVGYNAVALGFAAGGMLQPVLAAALMAVSSLLVIANSRRLERFPFGAASADVSCDEVPASESPAAAGAAPPAAVDVADTHSTRH
jgi:Cu2+-exporting ATPase